MYEVYLYKVSDKVPDVDLSNLPELNDLDFLELINNFSESSLNTRTLEVGDTTTTTEMVWVMGGSTNCCHSSDQSVVTISDTGTITAVGKGTAYVVIQSPISNTMYGIHKIYVK